MSPESTALEIQKRIKQQIEVERDATKFEKMVAALVGRLLDVPIAIAKSGYQHGGDAGPAGRFERRFRIECKKYSDSTTLSDRELLGEIDQAIARDEALEAWILVATCSVPEQLAQSLVMKGESIGVPVIILDWKERDLSSIAALCALDPDLVLAEFSKEVAEYARLLQPFSENAIALLQRDLQSWQIGFEQIRRQSHIILEKIWNSPRESNAKLGQNAAGGAQTKRIERKTVTEALRKWWSGPAQDDAPAAVIGWDGVGKTWATLEWLLSSKEEQPIVLIIPSSAVESLSGISEISVKKFIADRLYEVCSVRDSRHWLHRIEYLLKRPVDEGPIITLFFDGLNQEPSISWVSILKVLQSEIFYGRVRVIISTRKHHFENKLAQLRSLIIPVDIVIVDSYDTSPSGELDQMLEFEGLTQADLHPELIEIARIPRLFKLVVQFKDKLVPAGQVTVHRLLWEYGRDTLGERAGRSFSEDEWRNWLKDIAQKFRDGVQEYSIKTLGEMASRPDLSEKEVYARLSDIIDGQFVRKDPSGNLHLIPTVVAHALGAALLSSLDSVAAPTLAALESELTHWIDPIAGFDQRSEILRAAVSILLERGRIKVPAMASVLVTAWLQTQNLTDGHRRELSSLAPYLTDALLDAIEHSSGSTHIATRRWAVNALRAIPRSDKHALETLIKRLCFWFRIVSREVGRNPNIDAKYEMQRSERFRKRIGIDASGVLKAVGVEIELVDSGNSSLQTIASQIIEGFPLAPATPVFEIAAVASAVRGHTDEGWAGLKWLCLLNEVDSDKVTEALRNLAEIVRVREPEPGINSGLPARAAALLLWLSGQEQDEKKAVIIDSGIDRGLSYQNDYLQQPGLSLLPLERRHAEMVLNDSTLPLYLRIQRAKDLWVDPSFSPPKKFIKEFCSAISMFEVEKLNRHRSQSTEDHSFEEIEPILARCAPELLAILIRRKMQSLANCPLESRYWRAIHAIDHLVIAGEDEFAAAKALRLSGAEEDVNQELFAAFQLLMLEILNLDPQSQFENIIRANLKFIPIKIQEVLLPPKSCDVDALIACYENGSSKQREDLLILLSIHPVEFSNEAWSWIVNFTNHHDNDLRGLAFRALVQADPLRLGKKLLADEWNWSLENSDMENHFGSEALITATHDQSFDHIASILAPWQLLNAVRKRGVKPTEVRFTAKIFCQILATEKMDEPDPGFVISVDRTEAQPSPFSFSVSLPPNREDANNPVEFLKAALNIEDRKEAYQRALEAAVARVREARKSGAIFYLSEIRPEDVEPLLKFAPEMVDEWIDGYSEISADFRCRVRLSETLFLSLCEVLLSYDPPVGVKLWRALREAVVTRYIGAAGVDELYHMVFRAPDSQSTDELRQELLEIENCNSDQILFELAIAASYNGKADWLTNIIASDISSSIAWKRKRGIILNGFTSNNKLPIPKAWPAGEINTNWVSIRCKSERFRWLEACARHWWRTFLNAKKPGEAYAAWILFLRSADRRAWIWMQSDIDAEVDTVRFLKLKRCHTKLNKAKLDQTMQKRTNKLKEHFLNRKIIEGICPWRNDFDSNFSKG